MSGFAQYWMRILGALALIKVASSLVKDAEKLITSNVKTSHPEVAEAIDGATVDLTEDETDAIEDTIDNAFTRSEHTALRADESGLDENETEN